MVTACRHRLRRAGAPPKIRCQVRFQRLPQHERDVLALDIGADRIGRIVKFCPELLLASVKVASVTTAPIFKSFGSTPLNHSSVSVSLESRFFFSIFSEAMTPFIACMLGPLSAASVKNGRMLMWFWRPRPRHPVFGCAPWVSK